jgi:hypothetical protein
MNAKSTVIDTAKVQGRRILRFERLEDILADVDRLAQAKEIKHLGNWSPGQVLKHLSILMNNSMDGFRTGLPLWARPIMFVMRPFFKGKFLRNPMPPGFKLPPKTLAELGPPPTTWEEGLAAIRQALHRLQTETQRVPSPFLGKMTSEQWTQLHCRHSELHLSFLTFQE